MVAAQQPLTALEDKLLGGTQDRLQQRQRLLLNSSCSYKGNGGRALLAGNSPLQQQDPGQQLPLPPSSQPQKVPSQPAPRPSAAPLVPQPSPQQPEQQHFHPNKRARLEPAALPQPDRPLGGSQIPAGPTPLGAGVGVLVAELQQQQMGPGGGRGATFGGTQLTSEMVEEREEGMLQGLEGNGGILYDLPADTNAMDSNLGEARRQG